MVTLYIHDRHVDADVEMRGTRARRELFLKVCVVDKCLNKLLFPAQPWKPPLHKV